MPSSWAHTLAAVQREIACCPGASKAWLTDPKNRASRIALNLGSNTRFQLGALCLQGRYALATRLSPVPSI